MNEAAYRAILKRLDVELAAKQAPDPEAAARILGMSLDQFILEGSPLEVRVPWLGMPLWFVPGEPEAEALAGEGISRGLVWTARELMDLLSIRTLTPDQVKTIARSKAEFVGEVVGVRPRLCAPDKEAPNA